jgi:hypothetical protein
VSAHRTRKAAAQAVKDRLCPPDAITRRDVPAQLFIITRYTPGRSRPTWHVTALTPDVGHRFYGPFRQANVRVSTERLGVVWHGPYPDWIGRPID